MIWSLYYVIMYLMVAGIRISTLWNVKSRQWFQGRRGWQEKLDSLAPKSISRIWFHVSSLGEFEQARPVIQRLKEQKRDIEIILTFYSPSGYLLRSDYSLATVFYLPADLPGNAKKWISRIQPDVAVFVKYDLWPGYLKVLDQNHTPTFLISAHWIPGDWLSSWALPPTRTLLKKFTHIFLQEADHLAYFKKKGFNNLNVAGDTRIDRSLELPKEADSKIPQVLVAAGPFDLVAGSTWQQDEKILAEACHQMNLKMIIAPHDVSQGNIQRILKLLPSQAKRLSQLNPGTQIPRVILVDSIGLLSVLYRLGKIAYIGGGFGSGIHNILEPMAHQKPVIFGPAFKKFPEAVAMVRLGGARTISTATDLQSKIAFFLNNQHADQAGNIAFEYLQAHGGATTIVSNSILESIPYTGKI